jgi:hypothetical protein
MEEGRDPWELETEEQHQPKLEFKPKAHLVLEGSERHDWGIVKDCHGSINVITEDAEVVGTWNKYRDGTFWIDLLTPLSALEDKATQLYKELADGRADVMARLGITGPAKKVSKTPRAPKEPKVEQPVDEKLGKLRSLFTVK